MFSKVLSFVKAQWLGLSVGAGVGYVLGVFGGLLF